MKATIVSGADASFFDLLLGLVQSIHACPACRDLDLCILDVGLTPQQVAHLAPRVTRIVPAEWQLDFPGRSECPAWFKALYCRPFFPRYFPEYEQLIWIDADAWLCDERAIKLLVDLGRFDGIAIAPELDRAYSHCFHMRPAMLDNLRQYYRLGFGDEAARRFTPMPILNCGVFAMRRDVPYWELWSELLAGALGRCTGALIEQCALNVAVYTGRIPVYTLPSWCNWICAHAIPFLDVAARNLLVPLLPHEPISICHLTDVKRDAVNVCANDGTVRNLPLTYDAIRCSPLPAPLSGLTGAGELP